MAYFLKTLQAIEIYSKFQRLEREKEFSIEIASHKRPDFTLSDKLYNFYVDYIRCGVLKSKWRRLKSPQSGILGRLFLAKKHLLTSGTYWNFILKSIIGFLSGVLLTYLLFSFLLITAFDVTTATCLCALLAPVLSLGLAFSSNVRCVTLLVLPQFFSRQGRQILLAYAFLLATTGPARNTFHNMNILSDSLTCTQDQLAKAAKNIQELISVPFKALSDSMKKLMTSLKQVVQKVKDLLLTFKRLVLAIMSTIKSAFDWLESSLNVCNKKLGTPYERCMRVLSEACDDCKVQLYEPLQWMCSLSYAGTPVCYSVKWIDYLCDFIDWVVNGESIFGIIRKRMREFGRHLKTLFYVSISVKHSYAFETNQSRRYEDITGGMLSEIKNRSASLMNLADWASFTSVFGIFTVYMFYQVLYYRFRFLQSETFDNRFITRDLEEIDWRRTLHNRETILPLSRRESGKYVSLLSVRLVKQERLMFAKSAVLLSVSSLKLIIYLLLDYSLYWLLSIVRTHGRVRSNPRGLSPITLNVDGDGIVADILKSIIQSFKLLGATMDIDTLPCLPDPVPPDVDRYRQILSLIGVTWLITLIQPFGLRLRHHVMSIYHPDVARKRAVWLYNQILRKRSSFVKYMRRELRRKFSKSTNTMSAEHGTRISLKQRLLVWIPWLRYFMRDDVRKSCLVCGTFQSAGITLHYCPTPGCIGTYCDECYRDLHNVCTICKNPLEYGDVSDVSEEKDSSEDEQAKEVRQLRRRKRRKSLTDKRNRLLSKLKLKSKKQRSTLTDEDFEQVLPLYREYSEPHSSNEEETVFNGNDNSKYDQSNKHDGLLNDDTFDNRLNLTSCRVDLTSRDIFDQSLPLCTVDWTADRSKRSSNSQHIQNKPKQETNNLQQDTSDDVIVKQYISIQMEQDSNIPEDHELLNLARDMGQDRVSVIHTRQEPSTDDSIHMSHILSEGTDSSRFTIDSENYNSI